MDHDLRVPYVLSDDNLDLIRQMLDRDVDRRIGIQAVLDHPWCARVDDLLVAMIIDDGLWPTMMMMLLHAVTN